MDLSIPAKLLSQFSEFVTAQMGLHFPRAKWHSLEIGIASAAQEFGFKNLESCLQWILSAPLTKDLISILASHLTVGETYFFREEKVFETLEKQILPDLIHSRLRNRQGQSQGLRIWSAGCCTGEEPYSIAILLSKLSKMIPDLELGLNLNDLKITILATDINSRFLHKAAQGVYTEWSFRNVPPWIKESFFKKRREGLFEIQPQLKKMVTLAYLNLVEDVYPSIMNNTNAVDIIFCRNVLMYFHSERIKKVVQNLYHSLADGGWLIVGPSEASHVRHAPFATVSFPGAFLHQKDSKEVKGLYTYHALTGEMEKVQAKAQSLTLKTPNLKDSSQATEGGNAKDAKDAKDATESKESPKNSKNSKNLKSPKNADSEALELYKQDKIALLAIARTHADQGQLSEALEWCEKALSADKLNPSLYYLRAIILQEQGALKEAIIALKQALYLDQSLVVAHFALGNLALRQGKPKESEKHFENALSLLSRCSREEILPESEGLTAGRLLETIEIIRASK